MVLAHGEVVCAKSSDAVHLLVIRFPIQYFMLVFSLALPIQTTMGAMLLTLIGNLFVFGAMVAYAIVFQEEGSW